MEDHADCEAARSSKGDDLSIAIHPSNVGEACVGQVFCVTLICVNQVRACVAFVHLSGKGTLQWIPSWSRDI